MNALIWQGTLNGICTMFFWSLTGAWTGYIIVNIINRK